MIKNRNLVFTKAGNSSPDDHKFFQLPEIANASLPTAAAANEGGIVYDATNNKVYFSDGSSWAALDTAGGSGASLALDNLAAVAVNTDVTSDTDSTDDLGSSSIFWANSYIDRMYVNATAYLDGTTAGKVEVVGNMDVSGNLVVDTNLTVTGTANIGSIAMDALSAATTNGDLTLDGNGTGGVSISTIGSGDITLGDDTALSSTKTFTIAGTTAATDYLIITAGSFQMTDGNVDMDEGKLEIDTTTDETSYFKRNLSGATSAVVEIEATHTGDTGPALLIDHNGTGNAKGIDIIHNGDLASINIAADATRTGNVINIPMANMLGQTALDITGAATGTNGEGIIHVDVTGVLAGNAIRVDSTGANATTGQLIYASSTGAQAGATNGIAGYFEDTGAAAATSYTVYIASTSNEGLFVDTGKVQFDEALTLGVNDTGADFKAFGATAGKYVEWDESADSLFLTDSTVLRIGGTETPDGVTMDFDGADLDIDAVTANDNIKFGSDVDTNVIFNTASGAALTVDHGADTITASATAVLTAIGDGAGDGLVIPFHATASPSGTTQGSIFFEVDAKKLWVYDGTSWVGTVLA